MKYPMPQIVASEGVPPDTVLLVTPGEYLDITMPDGAVHRVQTKPPRGAMIYGLRHDCTFPGCQLSLGHPPPHCVADPDGADQYLMIDADGSVLRSL